MLHFITINTAAELFCFFVAIFSLVNDSSLVWRSFVLFLFITCVTEILGIHLKELYLADRAHVHPNVWLYNILLIFQAGFVSFMFNHLIGKYVKSKPIIISGLALLAILYIYELLNHGIFKYNELTNTAMLVIFVLYSLFYFYNLIKDDQYVNLAYSSDFWWVAGLLLFYFGSTASNIFFDHLSPHKAISLRYLSSIIFKTLNVLLYSCWSYSFICRKWLTMTSKS
jgi:hypothetical protein